MRKPLAVLLVVALALLAVCVGAVAVAPAASALAPSPTAPTFGESVSEADAPAMPAFVVADLVGDVAPESAAYDATTYQIGNWRTQGGAVGQIDEGLDFVQHAPGFMLGEKVGGYIDSAFGIDPGTPPPDFKPNGDAGTGTASLVVPVSASPPLATPGGFVTDFNVSDAGGVQAGQQLGEVLSRLQFSFTVASGNGDSTAGVDVEVECVGGGSEAYQDFGVYHDSLSGGGYTFNGSDMHSSGDPKTCSYGQYGSQYGSEGVDHFNVYGLFGYEQGQPRDVQGTENPSPDSRNPPDSQILEKICLPGSTCAAPATPANPARQWLMTTTCEDGTSTSSTSDPFHESDSTFPPAPPIGDCPDSAPIKSWELDETYLDGSHVRKFEAWTEPQSLEQLHTDHPECTGATSDPCTVRLWQKQADGTQADCFDSGHLCADWATDPNRSDRYTCTYGPASSGFAGLTDIGLSGCYDLGPTFDPAKRRAKKVYSDPRQDPGQGKEVDNSPGVPVGDPNPRTDPNNGDGGNAPCWPNGWGVLNPASWVLQPIQCAFEPSDTTLTSARTELTGDLNGSGWGAWVAALGGVFGALQGGGGCDGPEFDFDWQTVHMHGHPLSACSDPLKTAAVFSRAITTVFVIIFGGMACLRALGSAFGFDVSFGKASPEGASV